MVRSMEPQKEYTQEEIEAMRQEYAILTSVFGEINPECRRKRMQRIAELKRKLGANLYPSLWEVIGNIFKKKNKKKVVIDSEKRHEAEIEWVNERRRELYAFAEKIGISVELIDAEKKRVNSLRQRSGAVLATDEDILTNLILKMTPKEMRQDSLFKKLKREKEWQEMAQKGTLSFALERPLRQKRSELPSSIPDIHDDPIALSKGTRKRAQFSGFSTFSYDAQDSHSKRRNSSAQLLMCQKKRGSSNS